MNLGMFDSIESLAKEQVVLLRRIVALLEDAAVPALPVGTEPVEKSPIATMPKPKAKAKGKK